jgi:hypothetical protein
MAELKNGPLGSRKQNQSLSQEIKKGPDYRSFPWKMKKRPFFQAALKLIFQRSHVNDKAIFHTAIEQSLVSLIDFLNINQLDIAGNFVLCTDVEHFLGFCNTPDKSVSEIAYGLGFNIPSISPARLSNMSAIRRMNTKR